MAHHHQALAAQIEYSEKYHDAVYEYRHVVLPKELVGLLARDEHKKIRLQSDAEWRGVGIQMSRGWQHYAVHRCVVEGVPLASVTLTVQNKHRSLLIIIGRDALYVCVCSVFRRPEKHILLFRRKLGTDGTTGKVNEAAAQKAREQYRREFEGDYLA